ncbi:MAG: sensor histidine kinase, partial [Pseudomonadota bacterium]
PDSVVRLTAESSAGQVVVGVRNTGDRIPPDELGRVFDRFYRADKSRQRASGGTGLGLAIVQSIMELHGGTVRVESSEERGTVFSLLFPVAATARSR